MKIFNIIMMISWLFIAAIILLSQKDVAWWSGLAMSIVIAFNHLKDIFQDD
jgi:hypothetical protein